MSQCHGLFLIKYRRIVLQFWPRPINILYNVTYIHINVISAVELHLRDTALMRNHKTVLKPWRLNIEFTCCSDVLLSAYT